jgi:hypothetical protein
MMYREAMHSDLLITFMRRLIKDAGKKVSLIMDNLLAHHGKKVTACGELLQASISRLCSMKGSHV